MAPVSSRFGLLLLPFAPLADAWGSCVCQKPKDITTMPMVTGKDEYKFKNPAGGDIGIPATFGATCKSWDAEDMSKTFNGAWGCEQYADGTEKGNPNHFCRDTWCYVDACSCATNTPIETVMFEGAKGLFFSYDLCCDGLATETLCTGTGSMCGWDATTKKCSQKGSASDYLNTKCSPRDETTCKKFSSCAWADSKCSAASVEVREKALSCSKVVNNGACQCKMPKDLTTMTMFAGSTNKYSYLTYGVDEAFGGSCKSWDSEAISAEFNDWGCLDFSAGQKADEPNSFCRDTWCYVDACSCASNVPIETAMFKDAKGLYFSYDLCCAELSTEKACKGTGSMCGWDATAAKCSQAGDTSAYLNKKSTAKKETDCKAFTSCTWADDTKVCTAASMAARVKALNCPTKAPSTTETSAAQIAFVGVAAGVSLLALL